MLVFGYGSLMWDRWEREFGCTKTEVATLHGFQRDFNKASIRNWGSKDSPAPTLGLAPSAQGECRGMAFEFPDAQQEAVLAALRKREGDSFALEPREITLASGSRVTAIVPVNDRTRRSFLGGRSLQERAQMARAARGDNGSCVAYVKGIREKLAALQIQDAAVDEFARLVEE
jgi:cation transport protein ChaC